MVSPRGCSVADEAVARGTAGAVSAAIGEDQTSPGAGAGGSASMGEDQATSGADGKDEIGARAGATWVTVFLEEVSARFFVLDRFFAMMLGAP
jgi:hypothetical protein